MAIWRTKLTDFSLRKTFSAELTLEDQGNGHASGTLRDLSGPVPLQLLELAGTVKGNEFSVGGSNKALGILLNLTFAPFIFAFVGSARIAVHDKDQLLNLYVVTRGVE
ncbi:MAG TPA: hypothetical protein VOA87_16420 [Thermoanaerobaculia bacterium]|nr:hypothetical protein [Thermoanaerobaculia bacterium]